MIKNNIVSFSILIFVVSFFMIQYVKPGFLYNRDGSLKQFGIGHKKTTVLPAWLISIVVAILSYFIVLYYLAMPKFYY